MSRIKLVEAHRAVSDWENSRCLSGPNSCANTSVSDMYFCTHVELRKKISGFNGRFPGVVHYLSDPLSLGCTLLVRRMPAFGLRD